MLSTFYCHKRILVTGHSGFKGALLCRMLLMAGAEVMGYALQPPTQPSLYEELCLGHDMHCITGDVRDLASLHAAFAIARPELVFHLAAQPIVREGYRDPVNTYSTNIMGTVNVLDCIKNSATVRSCVNVTTDKVYRNNDSGAAFTEDDVLDGCDPYASSKSCSELVSACYARSYLQGAGVALSTMRAGNVIGGGDFAPDRIIPDCYRAAASGRIIDVRSPLSVRPYQFVIEPLAAYMLVAERQYQDIGLAGSYNVGPMDSSCVTTAALVQLFCHEWGDACEWRDISCAQAVHEAKLLRLDCAKIKSKLGWQPRYDIAQTMAKTVEWYKAYTGGADMRRITDKQISEYVGE